MKTKNLLTIAPNMTVNQDLYYNKQKQEGDCIIWTGGKHKQGYGMIPVKKNGKKSMMTTHKVAMTIKEGREIDPSEYVLRTCGCNACMNPDHLFLGTRKDMKTLRNYPKTRQSRINPNNYLTPQGKYRSIKSLPNSDEIS